MTFIIEALLEGKPVETYFATAKAHWDELLGENEEWIRGLAPKLQQEQLDFFERRCGGRYLGQEIMVASGIGSLMHPETERRRDLARALIHAFGASMCSVEVKSAVSRIAELYGFDRLPRF